MKTKMIVSVFACLLCGTALAQTAGDWINRGTVALVNRDLGGANSDFAQALALSPSNAPANVYYGATRVLVLFTQPAGSNFLSRLGFPAEGRNLYDWTASLPKDTNGLMLAPAGVSAAEFTAQARANILPTISGAVTNLASVTDTNFILSLSSSETDAGGATLDYGDVKLIQAALWGAEYFIYTLNAQNLDAQLSGLRALYTGKTLTPGTLLAAYPQLFTFATTNDLQNARAAFVNAVDTYFAASAFIRARPPGANRLFNLDEGKSTTESDFRLTLQDLKNSVFLGPQYLVLSPDVTVDMSAEFTAPAAWRSLLPQFAGNDIELGTLLDPTFGGVVGGVSQDQVESFLAGRFTMIPVIGLPSLSAGNTLNLTLATLSGHYYALEISTNLTAWTDVSEFTATATTSTVVDAAPSGSQRFYRVRDDTGIIIIEGVVLDQNTGLPIAHAQVTTLEDGSATFTDTNGQFVLKTTMPTDWYGAFLEVTAPDYASVEQYVEVYVKGAGLLSGVIVYLASPPPNDNFALRTTLNGANTVIAGNNSKASAEDGEPYDVGISTYGGKSVWYTWTAPTSGSFTISVSSRDFNVPLLGIYTGTQLGSLSKLAESYGYNGNLSVTLGVIAGQNYQLEVDDYYGYGGSFSLTISQ